MNRQLSVEAMRVIADATGLAFAKKRIQLGDDAALQDVAKTTIQLLEDLTRLKPGQLTEILEDARFRGDTALRDKVLDVLNAQKKNSAAS